MVLAFHYHPYYYHEGVSLFFVVSVPGTSRVGGIFSRVTLLFGGFVAATAMEKHHLCVTSLWKPEYFVQELYTDYPRYGKNTSLSCIHHLPPGAILASSLHSC